MIKMAYFTNLFTRQLISYTEFIIDLTCLINFISSIIYINMAENPEIPIQTSTEQLEKPLDTVVNTLIKNQSKQRPNQNSKAYDAIFKDIKTVLSDLDMSIEGCKKYNEAKIHRKYQIRIADLEEEVKILKDRLRHEQNARSPSKKYIEDLVDKLVIYKFENQKLKAELQKQNKAKDQVQIISQGYTETLRIPTQRFQAAQKPSQMVKNRQNSTNSLQSYIHTETTKIERPFKLKDEVACFLKKQENARKITQQPKSRFQHFLKKKFDTMNQWNFCTFLEEINKWYISYYNAVEEKMSAQLRSNVLSTLGDQASHTVLPPIITPPLIQRSIPMIGGSGSELRKIMKKRQHYKNRQNYSTVEVIGGSREKFQKFLLK